jgi:hypothetical protein
MRTPQPSGIFHVMTVPSGPKIGRIHDGWNDMIDDGSDGQRELFHSGIRQVCYAVRPSHGLRMTDR